jgi:hypothetical protein
MAMCSEMLRVPNKQCSFQASNHGKHKNQQCFGGKQCDVRGRLAEKMGGR